MPQNLPVPPFQLKTIETSFEKYMEFESNNNFGKALACLSLGLSLQSDKKEEYYQSYFSLLDKWCNQLEIEENFNDSLKALEISESLYPDCVDIHYLLARTLYRCGKFREGLGYIFKAISKCEFEPSINNLKDELTNCLVERWHFPMLNDRLRNSAYKRSIMKCVHDGYNDVLEIGGGTSLLSIYAEKAGGNVTTCEMDPFMSEISSTVLQENGISDINLITKHSNDLVHKEDIDKVSLIITETFDAGLIGEHALSSLRNVFKNIISKDSRKLYVKVLPNKADIFISIIECQHFASKIKLLKPILEFAQCNVTVDNDDPYFCEKLELIPGSYKCLTEWIKIDTIMFDSLHDIESHLNGIEKLEDITCIEDGRPDAIAFAFNLELEGEILSTKPLQNSCWENALFPILTRQTVKRGCELKIKYKSGDPILLTCEKIDNSFNAAYDSENSLDDIIPIFDDSQNLPLKSDIIELLNNEHYLSFYSKGYENLIEHLHDENQLVVCDLSKYPYSGIKASKADNVQLFVANQDIQETLEIQGINSSTFEELTSKVDLLFIYPLVNDGSVDDYTMKNLHIYRNMLNEGGQIFPKSLSLNIMAIESKYLLNITQVSNDNTFNVDLSSFNLFKVSTQRDLCLSSLQYKRLSPVYSLLEYSFVDDSIFTKSTQIKEINNLSFGNPIHESRHTISFIKRGSISAFVYWFTLNGYEDELNSYVNSAVTNQCAFLIEDVLVEKDESKEIILRWKDANLTIELL